MEQCTVQVHRRLAPVQGAGQAHHGVTRSQACSVPSPAPHNRQLEMGNPARDGTMGLGKIVTDQLMNVASLVPSKIRLTS